jgi:hypothetical protein
VFRYRRWKGWGYVFSLKVRIGTDVFKVESVKEEHFDAVLAALDKWYVQRAAPKPVLHGTLVFDPPTEQPQP